jgi:alpha-amylase/alpha-mannosidase (GH57 family)
MIIAAGALYVALIWHHHQPLYPKRTGEAVYTQPWVRLHATRDYVRMAEILRRHPGVKVTVNLTPTLLTQLEDLSSGATDRAYVLSSIDSRILTAAQKREIHSTFFSAPPELKRPLTGYRLLEYKPVSDYSAQDWRDLQTYFNLAWLAPDVQREPAMAALIRKGGKYRENDKLAVLRRHGELVREVIPTHARLAREGRLELTTSPYSHPILPLLGAAERAAQVSLAVETYRKHFGRPPAGMWPAEGAVDQQDMPLFRDAGIAWLGCDGRLLEKTLRQTGGRFGPGTRPDPLTELWKAREGPAIVFADRSSAARITSTYPSWDPGKAADDLVGRLRAAAEGAKGGKARMLGLVVDGAKAFEKYPAAGDAFLDALYKRLVSDKLLATATPADVLARNKLTELPGPLPDESRGDADLSDWWGEPEEVAAWAMLARARAAIEEFGARKGRNRHYAAAHAALRAAEGSDWFYWFGDDRNSGHDDAFDAAFRYHIQAAYRAIGREIPEAVLRPVAARDRTGAAPAISPRVDGKGGRAWDAAREARRVAGIGGILSRIQVGHDARNLYLAADFGAPGRKPAIVALGLASRPGGLVRKGLPFQLHESIDLQPGASASLRSVGGPPSPRPVSVAWARSRVEVAVPWVLLGVRGGEDLAIAWLELGATPFPDLPIHLRVPPQPDRAVVSFEAPRSGVKRFAVEDFGAEWAFVWALEPGKSALGRLEAYLAITPASPRPGGSPLLPGRSERVALPWQAAVVADGRNTGVYRPGDPRPTPGRLAVDPEGRVVFVAVPKTTIAGTPNLWNYVVMGPKEATGSADAVIDYTIPPPLNISQ